MPSLFFEDLTPGTVFELGSVTVSADEIRDFAMQFDPQPFHVDAEAASDSPFGGLIASGWHTASMWMRLYVDAVLHDADSRGSPGVEQVRWLAPVRPGDTLTGRTEVLEASPSSKDPARGTVFTRSSMTNQDGVVVMTIEGRGLFGRRASLADEFIERG